MALEKIANPGNLSLGFFVGKIVTIRKLFLSSQQAVPIRTKGPLSRRVRSPCISGGRSLAMRRWILSAALGLATLSNVGCIINQYSSDPNERMQEMLNESQDMRQIREEWRRLLMVDQPS